MSDTDEAGRPEIKVPLAQWLKGLRGTEEQVYAKVLRAEAGLVAKTAAAWRDLLEEIKNRPAHRPGQ